MNKISAILTGTRMFVFSILILSLVPFTTGCEQKQLYTKALDYMNEDDSKVLINESDGNTILSEGATDAVIDSYTIVLAFAPTDTVMITIAPDAQIYVDLASISFTTDNWNIPQTITVYAHDDGISEGNHSGSISHNSQSTDPEFDNISISTVMAGISDNDPGGINIDIASSLSVLEGSATSYNISLMTEPSVDVTILITYDDKVLSIDPIELVFTPNDWSSYKSINVTAANNNEMRTNPDSTITHTVSAGPAPYKSLPPQDVTVSIPDNDIGK